MKKKSNRNKDNNDTNNYHSPSTVEALRFSFSNLDCSPNLRSLLTFKSCKTKLIK